MLYVLAIWSTHLIQLAVTASETFPLWVLPRTKHLYPSFDLVLALWDSFASMYSSSDLSLSVQSAR